MTEDQGTPISTDDLLATIGEQTVQIRVLRRMLAQKLEGEKDATKEVVDNGQVKSLQRE